MRQRLTLLAALCASAPAVGHAAPQANAGVLAGVCGRGAGSRLWDETCFYGAVRADVIFGRQGGRDFGAGPYATVATAAFDQGRLGTGVTAHLPIHDTFPLLLSVGPLLRLSRDVDPGASATLFFGSRSYNHYSHYVMSGGLAVGFERTFGDAPETLVHVSAQVDGLLLALPFLLGYEVLKGRPD